MNPPAHKNAVHALVINYSFVMRSQGADAKQWELILIRSV